MTLARVADVSCATNHRSVPTRGRLNINHKTKSAFIIISITAETSASSMPSRPSQPRVIPDHRVPQFDAAVAATRAESFETRPQSSRIHTFHAHSSLISPKSTRRAHLSSLDRLSPLQHMCIGRLFASSCARYTTHRDRRQTPSSALHRQTHSRLH